MGEELTRLMHLLGVEVLVGLKLGFVLFRQELEV